MLRSLLLLCVVAALAQGEEPSTPVNVCTGTNPGPLPLHVHVEGCVAQPCPVQRDSDVVLHLVFRAPRLIRSMTTLARAYLLLFPVDYPLNENAVTCNFLTNTYCPLLPDEIVQYTLRMAIESIFPLITVPIEFRIEDENGIRVLCMRLQVTVMPEADSRNGTLSIN